MSSGSIVLLMTVFETEDIHNLHKFREIEFPADVKFHQLLITGPPGSGKSTLVQKIGGWPEEGYIDISSKRWWTSRMLSLRPREVHIGFPFIDFNEAMTIFDRPWVEASQRPQLDVRRIVIPPPKRFYISRNWRAKYVFEFLLPSAGWVFNQRLRRAQRRTHRVDEKFSLELIEQQLEALWLAARYLHHHGFMVYIREGIEGGLVRFAGSRE